MLIHPATGERYEIAEPSRLTQAQMEDLMPRCCLCGEPLITKTLVHICLMCYSTMARPKTWHISSEE